MSDSGRQGITTIYVDRVLISGNVMDRIAATMFDIESPVAGGSSDNITITGNVCPFGMYAYVVAAYTLSPIHNFAFTDNRLGSQGQMRIEMHPPTGSNFTFTGNIAGAVNSAQDGVRSAITVTGVVDTVRVTGNVIPTAPWNHGSPTLEGAPAVSIGPYVVKAQVSSNYLPVAYQFGEPHTFTQVLPLFSGAAPPHCQAAAAPAATCRGRVVVRSTLALATLEGFLQRCRSLPHLLFRDREPPHFGPQGSRNSNSTGCPQQCEWEMAAPLELRGWPSRSQLARARRYVWRRTCDGEAP